MNRSHPKIQSKHLARRSVVYLRQSTMKQVRENLESQRLQYALADRARELGWPVEEISTGHDLMITEPEDTAAFLMRSLTG